jgi:tetratricopeptide (TPR) repeat protein
MPKTREAALKALALDESLGEAHVSLATIAKKYDYGWETAEKEFRRAIQLNPEYATAQQGYAEYLSWQGRFDEALAGSDCARQLDSMSLIIANDCGPILYYARQYVRAIEQCEAVLKNGPGSKRQLRQRVATSSSSPKLSRGKCPQAIEEYKRGYGSTDHPWAWAMKAYAYAAGARRKNFSAHLNNSCSVHRN